MFWGRVIGYMISPEQGTPQGIGRERWSCFPPLEVKLLERTRTFWVRSGPSTPAGWEAERAGISPCDILHICPESSRAKTERSSSAGKDFTRRLCQVCLDSRI